jgi:carbon storage regulator CsrA
MLIVTRRLGEALYIGDALVTIHHIGPTRVKLSIAAPDEVIIRRAEIDMKGEDHDGVSETIG